MAQCTLQLVDIKLQVGFFGRRKAGKRQSGGRKTSSTLQVWLKRVVGKRKYSLQESTGGKWSAAESIGIFREEDRKVFKKYFIYLFLERGEGKEKERERNINVWLLLTHPLLGTWLVNQACALTGNWTGDPLVRRPALNPLSYTSQGKNRKFWNLVITGCEVQKVQRKGVRSCGGVKMGLAKQLNLGFQHMLNIVLNVE